MQQKKTLFKASFFFWVDSGARTHDTRNHNPMLCQLSYNHHVRYTRVPRVLIVSKVKKSTPLESDCKGTAFF